MRVEKTVSTVTVEKTTPMTLHTKISLAKSALRIIGYLALLLTLRDVIAGIVSASVSLIIAEGLGIAEEVWPNVYAGTTIEEKKVT